MTGIEIHEQFYMVEAGKTKTIFDKKEEAMQHLKKNLKDMDSDEVQAFEVDTTAENWKIKQIGWKEIAKYLI